jgi:hypothetical protein
LWIQFTHWFLLSLPSDSLIKLEGLVL